MCRATKNLHGGNIYVIPYRCLDMASWRRSLDFRITWEVLQDTISRENCICIAVHMDIFIFFGHQVNQLGLLRIISWTPWEENGAKIILIWITLDSIGPNQMVTLSKTTQRWKKMFMKNKPWTQGFWKWSLNELLHKDVQDKQRQI